MKKEEFIRRYGHEEYEALLKEANQKYEAYRARDKDADIESHRQAQRKGGRNYEKNLLYKRTGIPGKKNRIRKMHNRKYKKYKNIIAPDSQLHHQWIPGTAEYIGLALVEQDKHMHGIIDVIQILEGDITIFGEDGGAY